jgi:hypothetical protein
MGRDAARQVISEALLRNSGLAHPALALCYCLCQLGQYPGSTVWASCRGV